MAEIIPIGAIKEKAAARDVSRYWRTMLDEPLDGGTRISDLKPEILCFLAEPGDESTAALHAVIIGFLGHGAATPFEELDSSLQCDVIDISLFLSDQIRFEMMLRLGWLENFQGNQQSLYRMVTDFNCIKAYCQAHSPTLSKNHEDYERYAGLFERDQEVFIRRLFPAALAAFNHRHHSK